MTKARVTQLAGEYQNALAQWGEHNMITQRAEIAYREAQGKYDAAKARRNESRRAYHDAMTSCGLVRVKGALGGTYYE